jgi:hypothetical protein
MKNHIKQSALIMSLLFILVSCNKETNNPKRISGDNGTINPTSPIVGIKKGVYAGDPEDIYSNIVCNPPFNSVCFVLIIEPKYTLEAQFPMLDFSGYLLSTSLAHVVNIHHLGNEYPRVANVTDSVIVEESIHYSLDLTPWE